MMNFQPGPVQALWRIRLSDGWHHAELWVHPIGFELRLHMDGELDLLAGVSGCG